MALLISILFYTGAVGFVFLIRHLVKSVTSWVAWILPDEAIRAGVTPVPSLLVTGTLIIVGLIAGGFLDNLALFAGLEALCLTGLGIRALLSAGRALSPALSQYERPEDPADDSQQSLLLWGTAASILCAKSDQRLTATVQATSFAQLLVCIASPAEQIKVAVIAEEMGLCVSTLPCSFFAMLDDAARDLWDANHRLVSENLRLSQESAEELKRIESLNTDLKDALDANSKLDNTLHAIRARQKPGDANPVTLDYSRMSPSERTEVRAVLMEALRRLNEADQATTQSRVRNAPSFGLFGAPKREDK